MVTALQGWNKLTGRSRTLRLVDIHLRGAAQVMLQDHPLTGLLFLLGIAWGAVATGNPAVAIGAAVGLISATATALLLKLERAPLERGLYGFNGILVGVGVPTFLVMQPATWLMLAIGGAISTVAALAVTRVMHVWQMPPLTFPFVVTSWALILAGYSFGHVPLRDPSLPALAAPDAQPAIQISGHFLVEALGRGIGQVFLINDGITGAIFIVALLISSIRAALFALLGSAMGIGLALLFGADSNDIELGLYGFSPVLTAIAVGCVFYRTSWRVFGYTLLAVGFTVVLQGALNAAVTPLGIPGFTAAFVFVTWIFLLPQLKLDTAA